ncbi:MAG: hypothetical protein ONB05_10295 [candidate division KSB1 bacterium]|nr:hypothetical protein [candidate division KSB1 bacterium]
MQTRTLLIDGHVHLYPYYDFNKAVRTGINNLVRAFKHVDGNDSTKIWLLTERWDCDFFKQIYERPESFSTSKIRFVPAKEKEALAVEIEGQVELFILAGRQIVSHEGLEVLSLATDLFVKDRTLSTREVIEKVNETGGVAALNWAPGKWFFKRGKIVQQIFKEMEPATLLIGDTSLRHWLWPMPELMKSARQHGFKVIAGSDPLPFAGEEKYIGSYGFIINGNFDPEAPVTSIRKLLKDNQLSVTFIGKRNNPFTFAYREFRIMRTK